MKLRIQAGSQAGQEFSLSLPTTIIGRALDNTIVISDATVSRRHARIDQQGNGFVVSDAGSTSGTFVNGARLVAPQWLKVGDTLRIGQTSLTVLEESAPSPAHGLPQGGSAQPVTFPPVAEPPAPAQRSMLPILIGAGVIVFGLIFLGLLLVLVLRAQPSSGVAAIAATNTLVVVAPTMTQTLTFTPLPSATLAPSSTPLPTATPTNTPTPTDTATPTATPTNTPTSSPTLTPTPIPTPRRLSSGAIIKESQPRDGEGKLTVDNGQDLDAVAVLTMADEKPVVSFYILAHQKFTLEGIRDGKYNLFFMLGEDWDSAAAKFTRKQAYSKFADTFDYETTSMLYTTYSVTLYTVVGGNAKIDTLNPSEFPDLH